MSKPQKISARLAAVNILNRIDFKKPFSDIIDELLETSQQRQKTTDIVFGTIRNLNAVELVINNFVNCPVRKINKRLLNIVRAAVYELLYCPDAQDYSIVNEAVENTRIAAGEKQAGFLNALLRNITRSIINRTAELNQSQLMDILPQNRQKGCQFTKAFLPDPKDGPADYLSCAFSLPKWLIEKWLKNFGYEKTLDICFASNRKPSVYLRVNTLKISVSSFCEMLRERDYDFETIENTNMIKISSPSSIKNIPGYQQGLFVVQDLTSAKVLSDLKLGKDSKILDLCAAPGTKTTQLAEITQDKAQIFATDIDSERLKLIRQNINRLELKSINVFDYDNLDKMVKENGPFDVILLDVPCSNTGVLSKRPQLRHRITQKAITEITQRQYKLLEFACENLKTNGIICYSTCSIEQEENRLLIEKFLEKNNNFSLTREILTLPDIGDSDHDGGYFAILKNNVR